MKLSLHLFVSAALGISHAVCTGAYYFPADDAHHLGTLMTWPTRYSVYGDNITATRLEIATIAQAISKYEPVELFVYNDTDNLESARRMLKHVRGVSIFPTFHVDSLWARDTGPIFVRNSKASPNVSGVSLHFNEWGNKLRQTADDGLAKAVLRTFGVPRVSAGFTGEGGALEHDGQGTMMATESSILNPNRNPGVTKAQIEEQFARLFGIRKTIWFRGDRGGDITDGHVDGLARFVAPGLVALTLPAADASEGAKRETDNARKVLARERDAHGRPLRVVEVPEPSYSSFPWVKGYNLCIEYVNWYTVNNAVMLAAFGDYEADANAKRIVQELFPDRTVEQIQLRELAKQGGGIHCATQQIISSPELRKKLLHQG